MRDERRNALHDTGGERRDWSLPVALREAGGNGPTLIEGYGARYNEETIVGGAFREKFAPGSLDQSFRTDDILVTFNHNPDQLLGRKSNGTATFRSDAAGGLYCVTLNPSDPNAQSIAAKVQRRDVSGSSLVFMTDPDDPNSEEWVRDNPTKLPLRIIKRATVIEMGPVTLPYYAATTASTRSRAAELQAATSRTDADRRRLLQLARVSCPPPRPLPMTDVQRVERLRRVRSTGQPSSADARR